MYVRPLRYNKPTNQQLLDIFNFTNKSAVEPWQVTFGAPYPVADNGMQITAAHVNDYNQQRPTQGTLTRIEVIPTPESGWTKTLQLTYRRQVIQDHFVSVPFVIYATENTPEVILKGLHEQYGLYLDQELVDITFQQVDLADVLFHTHMGSILETDFCSDYVPPASYNALVKIKPNHPIWTGELNVYIREAVKFLDRSVKTTLEVHRYLGPGDHNKMPAEMILPNNRFVDYDYYMKGLKVGDLLESWIVDTAREVTGDNWVFTQNANPFNLYASRVVYNGLNTGEVYINDPKVSNVLIIQFSDEHCTNIRGQWVIGYYNRDTWQRRERIDYLPIQDQ
jgi:hypothetical protein